jgi:hypothetical protein
LNTQKLESYTTELETNCGCVSYCECWEDNKEDTLACLTQWLIRNGEPEGVLIAGAAMTWLRRTGHKLERNNNTGKLAQQILEALAINGEFILKLSLEGKELTARRSSHDEPTGASFVLRPVNVCQGYSECLTTDSLTEFEGANFCAWCLDIELANR